MKLPDTLPGRLYLLAYDPERERVTGGRNLDLLLRAAALTDLLRRGLLRDEGGKPVVTGPPPAGLDPVLAEQLTLIADSRPHRWQHWIQRRARTARGPRRAGGDGVDPPRGGAAAARPVHHHPGHPAQPAGPQGAGRHRLDRAARPALPDRAG